MKRESFEIETDELAPVALNPAANENGRSAAAVTQLIAHVLVIDDEPMICQQLERLYTQTGHRVTTTSKVEHALEYLENEDVDLVITDMRLPGLSGVDLIRRIQERWPDVPVIVMTGYAHIESAVEVLKLGASDYIVKPFSAAAIQESSRAILEKAHIFTEIRHLRRELKERCEFGGMLSKTQEMHRVFEIIRMVSSTDMTVVVEGETGTGKELVASAIHHQSPRRNGPFITINCAGFPETLLESELFGYERGAFTGADQARSGKIELAHGGTLFLDEIENMSISMQTKLLLVLQDQRVQRLGGTRWSRIDMRVIAASNVPLRELVKKGQMRQDFYYRINVIPIHLIPLRHRRDDIPLLVQDFLHHHSIALQKKITGLSQKAMNQLMTYTWPGNIRELHNVLEKGIVLTKSRIIDNIDIPDGDFGSDTLKVEIDPAPDAPLLQWVKDREKEYLIRKLEAFKGRIDLTAKSCGVDVRTIHRKMRIHGLDKRDFAGRPFVKPLA